MNRFLSADVADYTDVRTADFRKFAKSDADGTERRKGRISVGEIGGSIFRNQKHQRNLRQIIFRRIQSVLIRSIRGKKGVR